MKKTILALTLLFATSAVNSAAINYLELTGGTFSMDGVNYSNISPGEFANMTIGGYDGGERTDADVAINSIGYFDFLYFGPMMVSTQADPLLQGDNFRPVSGDITNDMLTLDLDSWTVWYGGQFYNQGANDRCYAFGDPLTNDCIIGSSGSAITTYNAVTGVFTADWSAVFDNGSFDSNIGTWHIEGNVSAVPVPAAVWLFGSGLLSMVGFAHRRKTA